MVSHSNRYTELHPNRTPLKPLIKSPEKAETTKEQLYVLASKVIADIWPNISFEVLQTLVDCNDLAGKSPKEVNKALTTYVRSIISGYLNDNSEEYNVKALNIAR